MNRDDNPSANAFTTSASPKGLVTFLNVLVVLAALTYIAFFLWAALKRLTYPYELEWIEGGFLLVVNRISQGKALYTPPSTTYVPYIYPPLYFYLAAGVSTLVGSGFTALRLISLGGTLVTLAVLGVWVWRETGRFLPALVAMGFYAGTYPLNGTWFDIGRVDALFLMWVVLGAGFLRLSGRGWAGAVAGVAFWLAFLTKQTTLTLILPLLLYALFSRRAASRVFLITFVALASLTVIAASLWTHGWFVYYTFYLPAHFHILPARLWRFWKGHLLASTGIASLALLLFLLWDGAEKRWERLGFYIALAVGTIGSSWGAWSHLGGFQNDLMPAHVMLALGLGLFLARGLIWTAPWNGWGKATLALVALAQLAALLYSPRAYIPRAKDLQAGNDLILHLRGVKDGVYVPFHPYLAERAGKETSAHVAAVADVVRGDPHGWGPLLREEIRQAIRQRKYEVIILDTPGRIFLDEDTEQLVQDYYQGPFRIFKRDEFFPVAGWRTRPERLYRR